MESWDNGTLTNVKKIPLLTVRLRVPALRAASRTHAETSQVRAGPRDGDVWTQRLKEEYQALIKYVQACPPPRQRWLCRGA
jgi:hypothetical protein